MAEVGNVDRLQSFETNLHGLLQGRIKGAAMVLRAVEVGLIAIAFRLTRIASIVLPGRASSPSRRCSTEVRTKGPAERLPGTKPNR